MAVAFGSGLEKIGSRAFAGCSSLATVTFVSGLYPEVAEDAFEGIDENCVGKCPAGMENDYADAEGLAQSISVLQVWKTSCLMKRSLWSILT